MTIVTTRILTLSCLAAGLARHVGNHLLIRREAKVMREPNFDEIGQNLGFSESQQ
jgi:hypothetical protein